MWVVVAGFHNELVILSAYSSTWGLIVWKDMNVLFLLIRRMWFGI